MAEPAEQCMYHTALQGLEQWQQPLAKIAVDQTVLSLAWNSMYFGMLGAMRLDPPSQVRPPAHPSHTMTPSLLWLHSHGHVLRSSSALQAISCLVLRH